MKVQKKTVKAVVKPKGKKPKVVTATKTKYGY